MTKKFLSIIVPLYNESANLAWHHAEILKHAADKSFSFEIIYVNDGSTDNSLEILKQISIQDPKTQYISFSRNFGKEAATSAGLKVAKGDAAIMLDADGQHPIELIDEFIGKWEEGFQVVVGVRKENTNEGFIKKYGSKLFYKILNSFTEGNTIAGSTDFRLVDRKVIDEFNKLSERNRITRGLIDWLGFKRTYINFIAPERHGGVASYSVSKLMKLAMHALVSQTTKPLQLTGFMGAFVTLLSAITGIALAMETYVFGDPLNLSITGTAIVALFVSFLVGIVLICQWLLALYIESIHSETQNRPLYIIDEQSND